MTAVATVTLDIEAHPDEVTRRDRVEHNRSQRMLRLWE